MTREAEMQSTLATGTTTHPLISHSYIPLTADLLSILLTLELSTLLIILPSTLLIILLSPLLTMLQCTPPPPPPLPPLPATEVSEEKLRAASSYIDDLTGKIDHMECELATARHNVDGAMAELQALKGTRRAPHICTHRHTDIYTHTSRRTHIYHLSILSTIF